MLLYDPLVALLLSSGRLDILVKLQRMCVCVCLWKDLAQAFKFMPLLSSLIWVARSSNLPWFHKSVCCSSAIRVSEAPGLTPKVPATAASLACSPPGRSHPASSSWLPSEGVGQIEGVAQLCSDCLARSDRVVGALAT